LESQIRQTFSSGHGHQIIVEENRAA